MVVVVIFGEWKGVYIWVGTFSVFGYGARVWDWWDWEFGVFFFVFVRARVEGGWVYVLSALKGEIGKDEWMERWTIPTFGFVVVCI